MIKAIALDDEPLALEVLQCFCKQLSSIKLVAVFSNTNKAMRYLKKHPVDVLFLDINMPAISGVDFAKNLPCSVLLVFTTAYSEYAIEGFNLSAIDFLVKPYSFTRFEKAVHKITQQLELQNKLVTQNFLTIRADYSLIKVLFEDILYIEAMGDYVKIFVMNKKTVIPKITLKSILSKLPQNDFIRVHRSYIISLTKVNSIKNRLIFIEDKEIPIGASYEENFLSRFIQK